MEDTMAQSQLSFYEKETINHQNNINLRQNNVFFVTSKVFNGENS